MKSWLNSLILNGSGFSFKSASVREQILPIQSKNDPFFAVSSLPALRLLLCCCSMATGSAAATADVRCCCAQQSGEELKGCMDDIGLHWRRDLPGLSAIKETLETFKLRGINLKDTIQT